jgi:hypothetical protein
MRANAFSFKRFLFVYLVLSFFSSGFAETPDRYTVVRVLQTEGPIDWVPYAGTAQEKAALFEILSGIVSNPTNLTAAIQNRALTEAGKFAADEDGRLKPEAEKLYEDQINTPIRNSNDTTLRTSLILSLQNAFVPESVTYLMKAAEQDDRDQLNENSTSLQALDSLRLILQPDPQGRPPLPDTDEFRFDSKIGTPFNERQRTLDWLAAVDRAKKELERMGTDSSIKKIKYKKIQSAREAAEAVLALASDKPSLQSPTPSSATDPTAQKTNSSATGDKARDSKDNSPLAEKPAEAGKAYLLVALGLLGAALLVLRFFRKETSRATNLKKKN